MPGFILALGILGIGVDWQSVAPPATPRAHLARGAGAWSAAGGPGKGKFLIARRSMNDPNFSRTVVLLIEYGEQGAMGLIINRPTPMKLSDLVDMEGADRLVEPVYSGGPVAHGRMLMLLRSPEAPVGAQSVFEDVHSSGSRELLERLVTQPGAVEHFRVYLGHAGWAPGQLEAEIDRGGWHVMPGDPDLVFSTAPSSVWSELIRRALTRWTRREGGSIREEASVSADSRGTDALPPGGIEPASQRVVPESVR